MKLLVKIILTLFILFYVPVINILFFPVDLVLSFIKQFQKMEQLVNEKFE